MSHIPPPSHVAQLNVARLRAPIDHADTTEFREALSPVNARGEAAPGYVWRLQTDDGDATAVRISDDPLTIVNLTLWESVATLHDFAYSGMHRDFLRRKGEWFVDEGRRSALWRLPVGEVPTVDDAVRRLWFLDRFGETDFVWERVRDRRPLVVAEHPLDHPLALELIGELNAELEASTPGPHFFSLDPDDVAPGAGAFVVAWLDGAPVGCGAVRLIGDGTAEVKRMYVRPAGRGARIGAAVLYELERRARALGADRMALETGPGLDAALGLYATFGFESCPPFGPYACSPASICIAKPL